jgi:dipeptidyl aminopeptidase/acylaminoacyl peptidase
LDLPEDIIASFQIADTQPTALFRGENPTNAYRMYAYDLKSQKSTLLSDPYKTQLDELIVSPVTTWTFTSSGNTVIDGRYYLPPNFDPNKKYPLIVYYYGGTSPVSRVFESTYPLQVYASLGYVGYTLQPSGTTGYGQEFSARHVNAWGKTTADEIIEGVQKFCREHPFVDSAKVGCVGASYGGFMTQYLQTKTDIFAAAVSHAGISSIASYWGEGYWGYAYSGAASAYSYPWNNPGLYAGQSPLFNADKINTPLLLLHGTADTNVPIGESIQMYNALKILGKEVEFIQVQGENHAIYDYKKRIEWNKTIYAWFAKWLKNQPEWWEVLYPEK